MRPGGPLAALPLHFVWIADCSGSMAVQGKMASLNHAAKEALPHMRKVAAGNPNASVLVRVMRFSSGAAWVIEQPTPLEYFQWPELTATIGGRTDLGAALALLTHELRPEAMPARSLPPVLVLCTDGLPTDSYQESLDTLFELPWGAKAVRVAIGIGRDADHETLRRFVNNPAIKPLNAENVDELVRYVRWASTSVLRSASSPRLAAAGAEYPRPPATPNEIFTGVTWK